MQRSSKSDFLKDSQKENIEELAEFVANYYSPRGAVDLEKIAEEIGVGYSYGNYEDCFDGLLHYENGEFHIFINIGRLGHAYTERARFTFAHELGHYFIDNHRNALASGLTPSHPSYTGFVNENVVEREADFFASCLLLPKERIKLDCNKRKFSFTILQEISKKYQASLTATALRFSTIGNHPIMVVYSFNNKINWYWFSADFRFWSLKHGKLKVPEDTAAGEFFIKGRKYTTPEIVYADDWFNVKYESDLERKYFESCIYGSNGSVVSIIWED